MAKLSRRTVLKGLAAGSVAAATYALPETGLAVGGTVHKYSPYLHDGKGHALPHSETFTVSWPDPRPEYSLVLTDEENGNVYGLLDDRWHTLLDNDPVDISD